MIKININASGMESIVTIRDYLMGPWRRKWKSLVCRRIHELEPFDQPSQIIGRFRCHYLSIDEELRFNWHLCLHGA